MISSIPVVSVLYSSCQYAIMFKFPDLYKKMFKYKKDEKITRLITKHGLPDYTSVLKCKSPVIAGIMGTCFKSPIILLSNCFEEFEEGIQNTVLLHEIGHLKHEDFLTHSVIMTLAVCVFDIYSSVFSLKTLTALTALSALVATIGERRADSYARKHATDQDLLTCRRFFIARDLANKELYRNETTFRDKVFFSLNWLYYHIFTGHPFNTTRLGYINQELAKRGVSMADLNKLELNKIEHVKNIILKMEREEEKQKDEKMAAT